MSDDIQEIKPGKTIKTPSIKEMMERHPNISWAIEWFESYNILGPTIDAAVRFGFKTAVKVIREGVSGSFEEIKTSGDAEWISFSTRAHDQIMSDEFVEYLKGRLGMQ